MKKIYHINIERKALASSFRCVFLIFAITVSFLSCKTDPPAPTKAPEQPPVVVDTDIEPLTKKIMDGSTVIGTFISDVSYPVSTGMKQTQIVYKKRDGSPMKIFVLEADMKTPNLSVQAMSPYKDFIYGFQPVSEMSRDNESSGTDIMAAINADFYNTTTGAPLSAFYINNRVLNATVPTGRMFFGQMNDGTLVMGGKDTKGVERPVDRALLKNAVGGGHWLVDNTVKFTNGDVSIEPRTAIGYTADKVIYVLVADGRQALYSNGLTLSDCRDILFALGTKDAINLDGGGSTTLVVKDQAKSRWIVQNKPSDLRERAVGNGLGFVLKR